MNRRLIYSGYFVYESRSLLGLKRNGMFYSRPCSRKAFRILCTILCITFYLPRAVGWMGWVVEGRRHIRASAIRLEYKCETLLSFPRLNFHRFGDQMEEEIIVRSFMHLCPIKTDPSKVCFLTVKCGQRSYKT